MADVGRPRISRLRVERIAAEHIPYSVHVDESVVRTRGGDYVQVFRMGGASFECMDDVQLNAWHEQLNVLWRSLASPHLALWTTLLRRRCADELAVPDQPGFGRDLMLRYRRRLASETLMVNELYLATVFRPTVGLTTGVVARSWSRSNRQALQAELDDALESCAKLAQTLLASLRRYDPALLGIYRHAGRLYSGVLEYFGFLVNGEWQRMAVPAGPVAQAIATSRLSFGTETMEYRAPQSSRVGAMLGIKEYGTPTVVGMYNRLLSAPFSLVLTQSFTFLARATGQGLLQRQINRMANAGDLAVSQAEELGRALDGLSGNEFAMGDHHFSLHVMDETGGGDPDDSTRRLASLNEVVAVARSMLGEAGIMVAREDLALEPAFWAQLPGNFVFRPRRAPITSRNFCAMAPFHNHPLGRRTGNHWGDALTLLATSANSPYYFSLHASDPLGAEGESCDTGHTLICGPTGSGKTVLIGFLIAALGQQGVTQVLFDKDRGLEILVRALGGIYLPLRIGVRSGFNPLQLEPTPENMEFLRQWLTCLVNLPGSRPVTSRETADLEQALRGVMGLDRPARRLSRLVEFLDVTDPEGVPQRLRRWCANSGGEYAWAFDNATDSLVSALQDQFLAGFDVTEFLDNAALRGPIVLYLFHVIRQLLDGRRLVCWMDEFWKLLADPAFEAFAKEGPKTWRKLNGVMCLATQSTSDILASGISRTLVEQTSTKIFFPNTEASASEYVGQLGLSDREFQLIREQLTTGSRQFLVKQGGQSVVCRLDLRGFDAELKVISGRRATVDLANGLIAKRGEAPAQWLSEFMAP